MAERSTPGAPNRYALVAMTPLQEQMLREAKAYHHITTPGMPSGWAFNGKGNLVNISRSEDAANPNEAPSVGLGVPNSAPGSSFGGQLLHALPYIAAAEFMGVPGALAGGGGAGAGAGATGAALGPSTPASIAGTSAVVGGSTVPASLAAVTPAELAAAGGAGGAAGAAGTTAALGPSTPASMAATQSVVGGSTVPASLSSAGVSGSSILGGVGKFLGSGLGSTLIGTAGSLIGAGIQSSGISKAAEIEAQFQREALAYEKQRDQYLQNLEANRYAQYNARVQPYQDMANTTGDKLAKLLGVNPASYTYGLPGGADQPPPAIPPSIPTPGSGPAAGPYPNFRPRPPNVPAQGYAVPRSGMTTQMVTMRGPDGSTKQVPQTDVSHYTQLGAEVIG